MQNSKKKNSERIICGTAVGLANSLFGGGGGMIAVPLLQRTGLDEKRAHATAILLILPISLFSFLTYAWKGFYNPTVLIPTAIGVTVGGTLGAKWLKQMSAKNVNLAFAALQAIAGLCLFFF